MLGDSIRLWRALIQIQIKNKNNNNRKIDGFQLQLAFKSPSITT